MDAIESEVFRMRMDIVATAQVGEDGQPVPFVFTVDTIRHSQLTAVSMALLAPSDARTYLRRRYGLGTTRKDPEGKPKQRTSTRLPSRLRASWMRSSGEDIITLSAGS